MVGWRFPDLFIDIADRDLLLHTLLNHMLFNNVLFWLGVLKLSPPFFYKKRPLQWKIQPTNKSSKVREKIANYSFSISWDFRSLKAAYNFGIDS